jgi:hypothetical protein
MWDKWGDQKMSISENIQAWFLAPILNELRKVEQKMSALDDAITAVQTQLTAIQTQLTQLGTDLTAEIARLQASGVSAAQLQTLNTIATNLQAAAASVTTLDTQAKGA